MRDSENLQRAVPSDHPGGAEQVPNEQLPCIIQTCQITSRSCVNERHFLKSSFEMYSAKERNMAFFQQRPVPGCRNANIGGPIIDKLPPITKIYII